MGYVDAGEGLVKQQDMRILSERPGEEDPLLLTARQFPDGPLLQTIDAQHPHTVVHDLPVLARERPPPAPATVPAHGDHVEDGHRKAPVHLFPLGDVGDGRMAVGERVAVNEDCAALHPG